MSFKKLIVMNLMILACAAQARAEEAQAEELVHFSEENEPVAKEEEDTRYESCVDFVQQKFSKAETNGDRVNPSNGDRITASRYGQLVDECVAQDHGLNKKL